MQFLRLQSLENVQHWQATVIESSLGELYEVIIKLKTMLGQNWTETALIPVIEFVGLVRENRSQGADHDTRWALLMADDPVRGEKVCGVWLSLSKIQS